MNKPTFATKVKEIYEKARVPLAYILVVATIVLRFLRGPELAFFTLIALCLILLPIIFEIHQFVTTKELPKSFSSFNEAIPNIHQALNTYLHYTSKPSIKVLGIALYYQWPMLDSYLTRILSSPNPPRLDLKIALVDPEWNEDARGDDISAELGKSSIASIRRFVAVNQDRIQHYNWIIEVWTYRYTPSWFGILVGEDLLFAGRSFWNQGRIRGGSNPLEIFATGDAFLGSQKIEEFRGWFEQCKQQKVDIGMNTPRKIGEQSGIAHDSQLNR